MHEQEARSSDVRDVARIEATARVLKWAMGCAAAVAIAWFLSNAFIAAAGKETLIGVSGDVRAEGTVGVKADLNHILVLVCAFSVMACLAMSAMLWQQRKVYERTISYLSYGKEEAERALDPSRTSSGLTREGRTPKDER